MLLKKGDKVRIKHLMTVGVCAGFTRDASGDVAAEVAYLDGNGIIQKTVLAITLLRVWQGSGSIFVDITDIST